MTTTKKILTTLIAAVALTSASMALSTGASAKGGGGKGMGSHMGGGHKFGHFGHRFGHRFDGGYAYARSNCWKRSRYGWINVCELDD